MIYLGPISSTLLSLTFLKVTYDEPLLSYALDLGFNYLDSNRIEVDTVYWYYSLICRVGW